MQFETVTVLKSKITADIERKTKDYISLLQAEISKQNIQINEIGLKLEQERFVSEQEIGNLIGQIDAIRNLNRNESSADDCDRNSLPMNIFTSTTNFADKNLDIL